MQTRFYNATIASEGPDGKNRVQTCVFTFKMAIEKQREHNSKPNVAFINYQKALDRVSRRTLQEILEVRGIQ